MSNMHRVQWFDQQIREGNYPNSQRLAYQFEISRRQAQRDIEYLEISLRAPLMYVAKHRGYIYEDKTFVLPHLYMTEEEKDVLRYLSYRYRHYYDDHNSSVQRVAHLLSRFTDEDEEPLKSSRLPLFSANPRLMQYMQLLSYAIKEHVVVQISYKVEGKVSQLHICPLKFVSKYNADYITANCVQQSQRMSFRLDCIESLIVTKQSFTLSLHDMDDEVDASLPVHKPFTARVKFQGVLSEETWNGYPYQLVQENIYDIYFYETQAFLQQLIVAEWTQLLAPKWLKEKLENTCVQMMQRLQSGEERSIGG
ncbi:helix-turn-helix transcriptional regulator [Paenibacillus pini]|uniref:WYL domain-containing protein n=1 Tax=Paenibacillus pini JCM 16418 TaxID=1236976 RepID=W7YYD2_9BACL|nr:WYL domain-containing protein [Paenibacillus pini]GAF09631.1 hypothetical protein JCM16418_3782 [Paenibacillus pini JCM 16418]